MCYAGMPLPRRKGKGRMKRRAEDRPVRSMLIGMAAGVKLVCAGLLRAVTRAHRFNTVGEVLLGGRVAAPRTARPAPLTGHSKAVYRDGARAEVKNGSFQRKPPRG